MCIAFFSERAVGSPSLLALNKKKGIRMLYILQLAGYKIKYNFCIEKSF